MYVREIISGRRRFDVAPTGQVVTLGLKSWVKRLTAAGAGSVGVQRVAVPVYLSAEMVPFSHHVGELRAHYAVSPQFTV